MVAENIKRIMIENNLSQKQFADKIGITYSALSRYLSNEREPKLCVIIKIAKVFGITTDNILYGKTNPLKSVNYIKDMIRSSLSVLSKKDKIDLLKIIIDNI